MNIKYKQHSGLNCKYVNMLSISKGVNRWS